MTSVAGAVDHVVGGLHGETALRPVSASLVHGFISALAAASAPTRPGFIAPSARHVTAPGGAGAVVTLFGAPAGPATVPAADPSADRLAVARWERAGGAPLAPMPPADPAAMIVTGHGLTVTFMRAADMGQSALDIPGSHEK